MELTIEQWNRIEPVISSLTPIKDPRGRRPRDPLEVLNGIMWILRTGAPWNVLSTPFFMTPSSTVVSEKSLKNGPQSALFWRNLLKLHIRVKNRAKKAVGTRICRFILTLL